MLSELGDGSDPGSGTGGYVTPAGSAPASPRSRPLPPSRQSSPLAPQGPRRLERQESPLKRSTIAASDDSLGDVFTARDDLSVSPGTRSVADLAIRSSSPSESAVAFLATRDEADGMHRSASAQGSEIRAVPPPRARAFRPEDHPLPLSHATSSRSGTPASDAEWTWQPRAAGAGASTSSPSASSSVLPLPARPWLQPGLSPTLGSTRSFEAIRPSAERATDSGTASTSWKSTRSAKSGEETVDGGLRDMYRPAARHQRGLSLSSIDSGSPQEVGGGSEVELHETPTGHRMGPSGSTLSGISPATQTLGRLTPVEEATERGQTTGLGQGESHRREGSAEGE